MATPVDWSQRSGFLWFMLYAALWDTPGDEKRARTFLDQPKIRRLVEGWGRPEDVGLIGMDKDASEPLGATRESLGSPINMIIPHIFQL